MCTRMGEGSKSSRQCGCCVHPAWVSMLVSLAQVSSCHSGFLIACLLCPQPHLLLWASRTPGLSSSPSLLPLPLYSPVVSSSFTRAQLLLFYGLQNVLKLCSCAPFPTYVLCLSISVLQDSLYPTCLSPYTPNLRFPGSSLPFSLASLHFLICRQMSRVWAGLLRTANVHPVQKCYFPKSHVFI